MDMISELANPWEVFPCALKWERTAGVHFGVYHPALSLLLGVRGNHL